MGDIASYDKDDENRPVMRGLTIAVQVPTSDNGQETTTKVLRPLADHHGQMSGILRNWLNAECLRERASRTFVDDRSPTVGDPQYGCRLPRFNYGPRPQLAFNQLYVPGGACRHTELNVLIRMDQHGDLLTRAWGDRNYSSGIWKRGESIRRSLPRPFHTNPVTVTLNYFSKSVPIEIPMFVADYRKLTGFLHKSAPDQDNIWAVRLVDSRYFWKYRAFGGMPVGRPPSAPPDADTPGHEKAVATLDTWWTWDQLLDTLSDAANDYIAADAIDSAKWGYPDLVEWGRPFDSVDMLIDALAASVQRRLTADITGRYRLEEWTTLNEPMHFYDSADRGISYGVTAGGYAYKGPRCERVLIAFPRNYQGHVLCGPDRWYWCMVSNNKAPGEWNIAGDPPTVADAECTEWAYAPGIETAWGQHPSVDVVYSTCQAYFPNQESCPENKDFLYMLARQIAVARFGWQYGSATGEFYVAGPPVRTDYSGHVDYLLYDLATELPPAYELHTPPDVKDAMGVVKEVGKPELREVWGYKLGCLVKTHDEDFGARHCLAQDKSVPVVLSPWFWIPTKDDDQDPQTPDVMDAFHPGTSRKAHLVQLVGTSWEEVTHVINEGEQNEETVPTLIIDLYDPQYQLFALSTLTEPIRAKWSCERNRWETAFPQGLIRKAKTTELIPAGGKGDAEVYLDDEATGVIIEVELPWMHMDQDIQSGKEIAVHYDSAERRWWIFATEC